MEGEVEYRTIRSHHAHLFHSIWVVKCNINLLECVIESFLFILRFIHMEGEIQNEKEEVHRIEIEVRMSTVGCKR